MSQLLQRALLPTITTVALTISFLTPSRASAVTSLGQQGCPNGQVVGVANLVQDGNFSQAFDGNITFTTDLPRRASSTYPGDLVGGGYAIQNGPISYLDDTLVGRPFAGDPSREVPPSETYFYSNPSLNEDGTLFYIDGEGLLWRQTVEVGSDRLYNFYAYFDNVLGSNAPGNDPVIELRVDDPDDSAPPITAGPAITVTKSPDTWVPIQYAFRTGANQTRITLDIWDVTGKFVPDPSNGSDFAMVGVNLRQCAWPVGIAKQASTPVGNSDGTFTVTYTLNLRNYSPTETVTNLQVVDDLAKTFVNAGLNPDGTRYSLISVSSTPNLTLNQGYTGRGANTGLLAPGNSLGVGDNSTATITITVSIKPGEGLKGRGPFPNTAIVSANSSGAVVEDDSNPGIAPDLDGNANPKDPNEDNPTDVNIGNKVAIPMLVRP
jgi:hypothetical protein